MAWQISLATAPNTGQTFDHGKPFRYRLRRDAKETRRPIVPTGDQSKSITGLVFDEPEVFVCVRWLIGRGLFLIGVGVGLYHQNKYPNLSPASVFRVSVESSELSVSMKRPPRFPGRADRFDISSLLVSSDITPQAFLNILLDINKISLQNNNAFLFL